MGCEQSSDVGQPRKINLPNRSLLNHEFLMTTTSSSPSYVSQGKYFDPIIPMFNDIGKYQNGRKQFYDCLCQMIGQLYTITISRIEQETRGEGFEADQIRVKFAKNILLNMLNLLSELQKSQNWKNQKIQIFKVLSRSQKKIIEFLKFKYPRNKKNFLPTDLIQIFQEMNDSEHTDYDLLINSKIFFDYDQVRDHGKTAVISKIKLFLNKIIGETNRFYDTFRIQMEKVFDGVDGNFKIGRKIPQNVSIFADTSSQNFQINSPQIFRIIIKWIICLQDIFLRTEDKLKQYKYFKVVEEEQDDNFNSQYHFFPLYTGKNQIIYTLSSLLQSSIKKYNQQQEEHQISLANFNDSLIKVISKKTDIPEINQEEIKTIKYAYYVGKFVQFLATEKLVNMIIELTQLREKIEKKSRKAIDLIKCEVSDLLRSQFIGKKNQLIQIFDKMNKLEKENKIKITRIKNRFATPLNDCLINFMFIGKKSSFLVCEIQLILQDSSQSLQLKEKMREQFNHILYEVQRSIFRPTAQLSLLLAYNDTMMGYENKIALEKSFMENLRCPQNEILSCEYDLPVPYICSLCSKFYPTNQDTFPIHRCLNCNFYACPKCLFEFDPDIRNQCYRKQISIFLKQNIQDIAENEDNGMFFFSNNFLPINSIKKKNRNVLDCLEQQMKQRQVEYAFILQFKNGKKKIHAYSVRSGSLLPTFYDFLPRSIRKSYKNQKFGQYDIILFLMETIEVKSAPQQIENQENLKNMIGNVRITKKVKQIFQYTWGQTTYLLDVGEQIRQNESQQKQIQSYDSTGSFQYHTNASSTTGRGEVSQFDKALANYKDFEGRLELDYLDIYELNVKTLMHVNKKCLRFIQLKSNRIKSVDSVLNTFENLQEIDASRNQIQTVTINKSLQKIRVIDLSENFIQKIDGFNQELIPKLKSLNLLGNNISHFPLLSLHKLIWLNLNDNKLNNVENLKNSNLPKLRKLSLSNNLIKQIPIVCLPMLLELSADCNEIKDVDFIKDLNKVECVSLMENKIGTLPQLELEYLENLNVSQNKIEDIQQFSKSWCPKIIKLDLSRNLIKELPKLPFEELINFNISFNQIDSIASLEGENPLQNLQWIDLSHNKISKIPNISMEEIEFLNLSHNQIQQIQLLKDCTFPSLIEIDLSVNNVSQIPPLGNLPSLKFLNLQKNRIQTIFQFMKNSVLHELKFLVLSGNQIQEFYWGNFLSLEEIKADRNKLKKINEVGEGDCKKCKIIDFSGNKIQEVPNISLESLEKLLLNKNEIKNLSNFKKSKMPKLQILEMQSNKIENFPSVQFQALLQLSLADNKIKSMEGLADSYFPHLQLLDMSANCLKQVKKIRFNQLMTVNLSSNELQDVSTLQDWETPQINSINLSKNKITQLCPLKSGALTTLTLSSNLLQSIQEFCQESFLPKLNTLNFNKNKIIGSLPPMRFQSLKNLEIIRNDLQSIESFVSKSCLPKLDNLKVSFNKIKILPYFEEKCLPKLKNFEAINNNIENIQDFSFSELQRLKTLNLQQNNLSYLPKIMFKNLNLLNCQSNIIQSLQEFERSDLPNLQKLSLKNNKISEWPDELYLEKLKKLNLAQNLLQDSKNINSRNYPQLLELNLRKNRIKNLKQIKLPKLLHLLLENNELKGNQAQIVLSLKEKNSVISEKIKIGISKDKKQMRKSNRMDIENKENIVSA